MEVLVVNAGSSSLKLRLLDRHDSVIGQHDLVAERGEVDERALATALAGLPQPDAVGHRIVHGGARYRDAVRLDDAVVEDLKSLSDLAPLHQLAGLAAHAVVERVLPGTPAVACFDTAFHATLPEAAATYALPREWRQRWPLRRYGFHGLSHAYAARRAAALVNRSQHELRVVSCHLGAGASLCAIGGGRSVDTTMGFTPLEGLVMATRSGNVDPGLLLWLLEQNRFTPAAVADALEHESGLCGLAGTADRREVLARVEAGDRDATLALDVYVHRLRAGIAAMAVALDGVDALVFTGGAGEHAPALRARTAAGLASLGIVLDAPRNAAATADADIGAAGAAVRTLVVTAREDLEIAGQVRAALHGRTDEEAR
ncbi:MAG: acetate/propionate family kinase [Solirubrobacteraceae bacterium]|nr:acetate/propionate family kinase [Solirubrobacteraceae bacterium]